MRKARTPIHPGAMGTKGGPKTTSDGQVLRVGGAPIRGLYACGNDMHSIFGGVYAGPGITLGPGLVFAYIAMRDAMQAAPAAASAGTRLPEAEPA